jgi:hypothetical protein
MRLSWSSAAQSNGPWSRLGIAGFSFFLLKGLLWLLAPVLFTFWR